MLRSSLQQRGRPLVQLLGRAVSSSAAVPHAEAAPQPAPDHIEVFVNDEPVHIPKGSSVLQACDAAGIDIPRWVGVLLLLRTIWASDGACVLLGCSIQQTGCLTHSMISSSSSSTRHPVALQVHHTARWCGGETAAAAPGSATTSGSRSPATAACAWSRWVVPFAPPGDVCDHAGRRSEATVCSRAQPVAQHTTVRAIRQQWHQLSQ
jgi:hypothetical protein